MSDTSAGAMNEAMNDAILEELRVINMNLRDIAAALIMLQPFISDFVRWGNDSLKSKIRVLGDIYRDIEESAILQ